MSVMRIIVLHPYTKSEVHSPSCSEATADFRSRHLSVLVTLTFDLLTLELVCNAVARTTFLPLLVLVRLFFVQLWANTHQTDDVTL